MITGSTTFAYNEARGGSHGTAGESGNVSLGVAVGGALFSEGRTTIADIVFDHNDAIGGHDNMGGSNVIESGRASGGAINTAGVFKPGADFTATNLTLTNNRAIGGARNSGGARVGTAEGGGLSNLNYGALVNVSFFDFPATATLSNCTLTDNQAIGGQGVSGSNGGDSLGGGIYTGPATTLTLVGSSITGNSSIGGPGAIGGTDGLGLGGGIYIAAGGTAYADLFTLICGNQASSSNHNVFGILLPI